MKAPCRLPTSFVQMVLVSGEYPELAKSLESHGVKALLTLPDARLPAPVQWHPDMQLCVLKGETIAVKGKPLQDALTPYGIPCKETVDEPDNRYPKDALCNVLVSDDWALGNEKTADATIRQAVAELGLEWIQVRQGYTACAAALVDRSSVITEDSGVALALEQTGVEVLRLVPGGVALPGYEYGFFGGCCGLLSPYLMAFSGRLNCHPEEEKVREFLARRGVQVLELLDRPLLDVGGILPLA